MAPSAMAGLRRTEPGAATYLPEAPQHRRLAQVARILCPLPQPLCPNLSRVG